jgi:hypothetical protein
LKENSLISPPFPKNGLEILSMMRAKQICIENFRHNMQIPDICQTNNVKSLKKSLFAAQTRDLGFCSAAVMRLVDILIQLRGKFALRTPFPSFSEISYSPRVC